MFRSGSDDAFAEQVDVKPGGLCHFHLCRFWVSAADDHPSGHWLRARYFQAPITTSRFESSRPSQPVRRLETLPSVTSETPANGGLLRIGYRSPGSEIGRCGTQIAESLRRIFEIFPFSGDSGWRLGSILTAWRTRQSNGRLNVDY